MGTGTIRSSRWHAESVVRDELRPGEKLLWTGQPRPVSLALTADRLGLGGFGLVFGGFSLFWMHQAYRSPGEAPSYFWTFGIPFLLIGLGFVLQLPLGFLEARRVAYAITDRRLLVITSLVGRKIRSFEPQDINMLERREGVNGYGSVLFRQEAYYGRDDGAAPIKKIGFYGVPDARRVEREIASLRARS
jgi:hypothetical protein